MKKIILIICFSLGILVFTNPSSDSFEKYVSMEDLGLFGCKECPIKCRRSQNWFILSVYEAEQSSEEFNLTYRVKYIAALGNFFKVSTTLK